MNPVINRNMSLTETINLQIMENELSATDWNLNPLAWDLYWWVDLFQAAFFKDEPVPIPVLTFERSRVNTLGSYRIGRNDFAVREQININRIHLDRPEWTILATLFHEMVHSFEYTYIPENKRTKNWYHGKAFRDKMLEFGIICADNGSHLGLIQSGKFCHILRQHGVRFEIQLSNKSDYIPSPPKPKIKGKSKLKKWSCGCQIVRVGKSEFHARCTICNQLFELDE